MDEDEEKAERMGEEQKRRGYNSMQELDFRVIAGD